MRKSLAKFDNDVLKALADIYVFMHLVDLRTFEQYTMSDEAGITRLLNNSDPLEKQIKAVIDCFCIPEDRPAMFDFMNLDTLVERLTPNKSISCEFRGVNLGWCRARFIATERDANNVPTKAIYTVLLINAEKRKMEKYHADLERALSNQNEIYGEMLQMQGGGFIAAGSVYGDIVTINDSALEMLGLDKNNFQVKTVTEIFDNVSINVEPEVREQLAVIAREGGQLVYELSVALHEGIRYIKANTKQITTQNGNVFVITTLSDITSNKEHEKALKLLSDTDVLTGIHNRGYGERKVKELLAKKRHGMFCLLDVDKFKDVNDNYGHQVGDMVLIKIASILQDTLRHEDVLWRMGGDEFGFFALDINSQKNGAECLRRLFRNIENAQFPEMGNRGVTFSVGALLVGDEDCSFEELYKQVDDKLYRSKDIGGNHFEF